MDVSFIIPIYNQLELTLECLRTLQETVKTAAYEIILVDDASQPENRETLRSLTNDKIKLVQNSRNMGYAHSNNIGALHANGKYLFLLNNDLVLLPNWIEPMLKAFDEIPNLGIIGNVQLSIASGKIDHAGTFIAPKGNITHKQTKNRSLLRSPNYSRFDVVTGACCAIRRSLYQQVGGFDEAFVNGGEDVDLCFRLAAKGYKVFVANKSVVKHHVSATRKEPNDQDEWNSRLLQNRWSHKIANHTACGWPDRYLAQAIKARHLKAIDANLLTEALLRYLFIKKGPSPSALYNAYCEQERNERHWKIRLDGWSDDMIKQKERTTNSSLFKDRYNYQGLYANDAPGVWIRETATITLPPGIHVSSIAFTGEIKEATDSIENGALGLSFKVNNSATSSRYPIEQGKFEIEFDDAPSRAQDPTRIEIKLLGVERSNTLAYLGRKLAKLTFIPGPIRNSLAKYREQRLNKRLAIHSLSINGDQVFNFAKDATNPLNTDYVVRHAQLGINLVGWFKAELGIGESARLAAKATKASGLPCSLVPLKVNCLASQGDNSLENELSEDNPHPINIFHIDAPQSPDIDHYHGKAFRDTRYNIAYWAWELPDFPDEWIQHFRYYDEIWTPSNFVRDSIAVKSPVPVLTMPHCIDFKLPERDYRQELGLPKDKFLFNFAYDLNSYQERKNPRAAIEAFKAAFSGSDRANDVGLVIKIHSSANNKTAYRELLELLKDLPNYYLIDRTLSRETTYGLMAACDSYLSLHRSEGFGLTVAESMFLEKPVISTNWSATSEFVNANNACPVDFTLIPLEKNHGPYKKGQLWANPDPLDAARHMQELVANPERAAALGKRAKETIAELYSPKRIGNLYRQRLRSIALW